MQLLATLPYISNAADYAKKSATELYSHPTTQKVITLVNDNYQALFGVAVVYSLLSATMSFGLGVSIGHALYTRTVTIAPDNYTITFASLIKEPQYKAIALVSSILLRVLVGHAVACVGFGLLAGLEIRRLFQPAQAQPMQPAAPAS
jgi:hypothetical protein